jgi:hypothetical protein
MMTATEFRRQSALYMDEAKDEEHRGIRSALLALKRTCVMMANQIDRLDDLRERERELSNPHAETARAVTTNNLLMSAP